LRGRPGLAFLPAAPLEILKVGGQPQVQILLFGEILEQHFRSGGGRPAGVGVGGRLSHGRMGRFSFHGIMF